jgi:anion-transporting  ArsA/GET3 family ATPase
MVTIPEALGVYQSGRVIGDLEKHGLDVHYVIINDVIVAPDCGFHRQRMEMQRPYIQMLDDEYGDRMTLIRLPLLPYEVKGVERLKEVEGILFGSGGSS